jgi:hypothetical protein
MRSANNYGPLFGRVVWIGAGDRIEARTNSWCLPVGTTVAGFPLKFAWVPVRILEISEGCVPGSGEPGVKCVQSLPGPFCARVPGAVSHNWPLERLRMVSHRLKVVLICPLL